MFKKFLFWVYALVCAISLFSCGSDDNNEPTSAQDNKITLKTIEGVWTYGDYFISFSSDKFCTSFVAPGFLDSGNFQLSGNVVTCRNSFFNHVTTYTIKVLTSSMMIVQVEYTDFKGHTKIENLTLYKKTEIPIEKDNPLVGKSYIVNSNYFGTITYTFTTYCNGQMCASSGSAKKYPINIFYIWRDGKYYEQFFTIKNNYQRPSIGGWDDNADNGKIFINSVTFTPDGSIESVNTIKIINY